ncbi:aquaporin AQPAn.G-like isoform X2 [Harmonia axyridis]|nr:aquaporin AQPAn.G-like isoform X2 [Harmonia axyridis]
MQNGQSVLAPVEKSPQPAVAKWTPSDDQKEGNVIGAKAKKIYMNDNLSTLDRIVLCFAEFLGTGMLIFIGCMGCANMGSLPDPMKVSFAFGLAIMIAVQCFGHISGSHINPAVTVAAVILGHTPVMHIPLYFIGQLLGGIGGFGLLKALSPVEATEPIVNGTTTHICSPGPLSSDLHPWQGVGVEFALTFILVMLCAAVWDCRNTDKVDSLSIRLGLAVAVLAMVGASYTGANMNPARSFGPALINGDWDNWWIWWVGPMLGGLVAGLLYRIIFSKEYDMLEHSIAEVVPMNERA